MPGEKFKIFENICYKIILDMQNQKYIDMCSGSRVVTAPPIDSGGPSLSMSGHHCSNRFDLGAGHIQAFLSQ